VTLQAAAALRFPVIDLPPVRAVSASNRATPQITRRNRDRAPIRIGDGGFKDGSRCHRRIRAIRSPDPAFQQLDRWPPLLLYRGSPFADSQ